MLNCASEPKLPKISAAHHGPDTIRSHLLREITSAQKHTWPFEHRLVHDVFPWEFYRALRRRLPSLEAYTSLSAPGEICARSADTRAGFSMDEAHLSRVGPAVRAFWRELLEQILDDRFAQALLELCRPALERQLRREGSLWPSRVQRELSLSADRGATGVELHSADPDTLLTLLFYLPEDESMRDAGTALYCPRDHGDHPAFERFEHATSVPYLPNSLFMFAKTERAFHGVVPSGPSRVRRDVLRYCLRR